MTRVVALDHSEVTFYVGPGRKAAQFEAEIYVDPETGGRTWRGVFETDDPEMLEWFNGRPAAFKVEGDGGGDLTDAEVELILDEMDREDEIATTNEE